jgi:tetratricopeptide (TPR) repeat protein
MNLLLIFFRCFRDVEKAVQYYGKSIQLCPHFIKAYHNRSIVFYYSDDYEAADKDCETIFSINPDFAPAYAWRGRYAIRSPTQTFSKIRSIHCDIPNSISY